MRWGLLWWNLMSLLVRSLAVEEDHMEPLDEPVEPVDTVEQLEQFLELPTTQASRLPFYKPGTDFYSIPELYRNIKAGNNVSGFYMGPTFSKEFNMKTPSGKRITTGFKLLDWKRRRKRLDDNIDSDDTKNVKTGYQMKKECIRDKGENYNNQDLNKVLKSVVNVNNIVSEREQEEASWENIGNDERVSSIGGIVDKEKNEDAEEKVKVYTQPQCGIRLSSTEGYCDIGLSNRPSCCLNFNNETVNPKYLKRKNCRSRKRSKREEEASFEEFEEYKRSAENEKSRNLSLTSSVATTSQSVPTSIPQTSSIKVTSSRSVTDQSQFSTTFNTDETGKPIVNIASTTQKPERYTETVQNQKEHRIKVESTEKSLKKSLRKKEMRPNEEPKQNESLSNEDIKQKQRSIKEEANKKERLRKEELVKKERRSKEPSAQKDRRSNLSSNTRSMSTTEQSIQNGRKSKGSLNAKEGNVKKERALKDDTNQKYSKIKEYSNIKEKQAKLESSSNDDSDVNEIIKNEESIKKESNSKDQSNTKEEIPNQESRSKDDQYQGDNKTKEYLYTKEKQIKKERSSIDESNAKEINKPEESTPKDKSSKDKSNANEEVNRKESPLKDESVKNDNSLKDNDYANINLLKKDRSSNGNQNADEIIKKEMDSKEGANAKEKLSPKKRPLMEDSSTKKPSSVDYSNRNEELNKKGSDSNEANKKEESIQKERRPKTDPIQKEQRTKSEQPHNNQKDNELFSKDATTQKQRNEEKPLEIHSHSKQDSTEMQTSPKNELINTESPIQKPQHTDKLSDFEYKFTGEPTETQQIASRIVQDENSSFISTESTELASKSKAKIVIGGSEMPLHTKHKSEDTSIEHMPLSVQSILQPSSGVIFACVTPPPATTLNVLLREDDAQRAECHPKGSGPLSPMSYDPEAYGPRNEEEVEDALTGKLADRVVEVVMAKVGKTPRMMKELGLYAQGNLTKIQCSVSHPDGKQICREQSSETLKLSVLQDIAAAVERLAGAKSNGLCLKPPEDLADFLSWLLSEDSEMEMPEPPAHLALQPRREADYLFRASGIGDELINDVRELERSCNWDSWINFAEESSEDIPLEKTPQPDEFEGKGHVQLSKNYKRVPRHLAHRKRIARKSGEHGRRRRYTPWSLNDYP